MTRKQCANLAPYGVYFTPSSHDVLAESGGLWRTLADFGGVGGVLRTLEYFWSDPTSEYLLLAYPYPTIFVIYHLALDTENDHFLWFEYLLQKDIYLYTMILNPNHILPF